jgi:hypothetical protein
MERSTSKRVPAIAAADRNSARRKRSESDILKQSAYLYTHIAKFVILYYYVERKELQIDLELSEQNYKSDSYQIRVKKDLKGTEKSLLNISPQQNSFTTRRSLFFSAPNVSLTHILTNLQLVKQPNL